VTTSVLPLASRQRPPAYVRLYTKARVYKVQGYGWVWSHVCDHNWTTVSPTGLPIPTQDAAFEAAWTHMKRCVG
jgi:hypothetical protein